MSVVEIVSPESLSTAEERELRAWLGAAYAGDFADEDWTHTFGGRRALIRDGRGIVSHAAIVPRNIVCDGRPLYAGYVEAVATRLDQRRRGHAHKVLGKLGEVIARDYDIGVLSTGLPNVYSPLGWERWRGASYVQMSSERLRTAEDDDGLMVLLTSRTRHVDLRSEIVADWRDGDIW
jgi:aminoglycoside 2'-N-acetyltransferase I